MHWACKLWVLKLLCDCPIADFMLMLEITVVSVWVRYVSGRTRMCSPFHCCYNDIFVRLIFPLFPWRWKISLDGAMLSKGKESLLIPDNAQVWFHHSQMFCFSPSVFQLSLLKKQFSMEGHKFVSCGSLPTSFWDPECISRRGRRCSLQHLMITWCRILFLNLNKMW
jgi:hypothetical protein